MKFSRRGKVSISRKKEKTARLHFTKCVQVELEHRNKKFGLLVDQKLWCWVFFHRSVSEIFLKCDLWCEVEEVLVSFDKLVLEKFEVSEHG